MTKIGLYVYQLVLSRSDDYQRIPFDTHGPGSQPSQFMNTFIQGKLTNTQNNNIERSWRLNPRPPEGRSYGGLVEYGTFGISSKMRSSGENDVLFERRSDHVEEIPLYYQIWIPENANFGFAAFQSYRDRSCVGQVLSSFTKEYNDWSGNTRLTARKVMPPAEEMYAQTPVKKLILSRKRVPKDRVDILQDLPPEEVDIELSISALRRRMFGRFTDVAPLIEAANGTAAMVINGIEFDEASALISIGGTYRKVGIIGPENTAGVIDITDNVELQEDGHPLYESLERVATQIIVDFREQYGMN